MTSPTTADLNEARSVVLDGSGNGSVTFSPSGTRYSGYSWSPSMLYVSVAPLTGHTAPVLNAGATAYVSYGVQSATPNDAIGSTVNGSLGDTCGMTQNLRPNDFVTVKWTGGDVGAVATARLTGSITLPNPGGRV